MNLTGYVFLLNLPLYIEVDMWCSSRYVRGHALRFDNKIAVRDNVLNNIINTNGALGLRPTFPNNRMLFLF